MLEPGIKPRLDSQHRPYCLDLQWKQDVWTHEKKNKTKQYSLEEQSLHRADPVGGVYSLAPVCPNIKISLTVSRRGA